MIICNGIKCKRYKKEEFFVIEVKNVTKKYGSTVAVDNASFTINDGEIVGLLRTKWCREKHNNEYAYRFYRTNFRRHYNRWI